MGMAKTAMVVVVVKTVVVLAEAVAGKLGLCNLMALEWQRIDFDFFVSQVCCKTLDCYRTQVV